MYKVKQIHACVQKIYVISYIDDILIESGNINKIDTTANFPKEHFHVKDLGILKHYLGIEVGRNENV